MVVTPAVGRVGWIRAAARPAAAAAPPRLCNPRLCCALLCALCSATLLHRSPWFCCVRTARLGNQPARSGKFGASRRALEEQVAAAALLQEPLHRTTLCRARASGRARRDLCQGHAAPRALRSTPEHFTARTFSYSSAHFVQVCARGSLPFRLGKTCLCFQHDAGKPQLLMWFRKYVSDEFSGFW